MNKIDIFARLRVLKIICRTALGLVWLYEGVVPKLLFLRADELDLVKRWDVVCQTPERTLQLLGVLQIALGLWLLVGVAERLAVIIATLSMFALIVLVAVGSPEMLTEPYGALVKDLCLLACGIVVWLLSSIAPEQLPK